MKINNKMITTLAGLVCLLMPSFYSAQEASKVAAPIQTENSDVLFYLLLGLIGLLLVTIFVLAQTLRKITSTQHFIKKWKERSSGLGNKTVLLVLFSSVTSVSLYAQGAEPVSSQWSIGGMDSVTFLLLLGVILFEIIVIGVLYKTMMGLLIPREERQTAFISTPSIIEQLNASVSLEKENDIMFEHEYDGIRELDNDLPPWWKYGFYATIVFAFIYFIGYHITGNFDSQTTEYEKEIAQAKVEVEEFMKNSANKVDENTVKLLSATEIESGKAVYVANCAACHGNEGQGTVGPNLTDPYWIHGGGLSDIFKSIKYGWVDKGMKSWKDDLSPMQIAQITSYIKSIQGTNPQGAKEPQGVLYQEQAIGADSLNLPKDSTLSAKVDTLSTQGIN